MNQDPIGSPSLLITRFLFKEQWWIETDEHTYYIQCSHAQNNHQFSIVTKKSLSLSLRTQACMVCRFHSKDDQITVAVTTGKPYKDCFTSFAKLTYSHTVIHVTSWTSRSLLSLRPTRRTMWQCVAKSLCDCHRHGHWEPRLWMALQTQDLHCFAVGTTADDLPAID